MKQGENQKLRIACLMKIFFTLTDSEHALSLREITDILASEYEIRVSRYSLYADFIDMEKLGCPIVQQKQGRNTVYRLASHPFELAELKLLVDSVQSAKFITEEKSREIIRKLESLASVHEGRQLHRQVLISGRVKARNTGVMENVDLIHNAMNSNRQICFQYFQWNWR